jgi:hypothetical protein
MGHHCRFVLVADPVFFEWDLGSYLVSRLVHLPHYLVALRIHFRISVRLMVGLAASPVTMNLGAFHVALCLPH